MVHSQEYTNFHSDNIVLQCLGPIHKKKSIAKQAALEKFLHLSQKQKPAIR